MESVNENWLPHLHPEVVSEVEGNYLDAYVVALEGWRRGLTLRWHVKDSEKFKEMKTWYVERPGQLFSLHSEDKSHYFFRTRGDKVTNEAVEKGMDKQVTKQILKEAGIPVPEGKEFTNFDSEATMIEYASTLGYPVVVKPTDGSFGRGVVSDINTEEELKLSLQYVREELEEKRIIVEKHIPGKDYRLYVVENEVVGAILRVPANVVGDGINSIEALIEIKNSERKLNPRLTSCPILTNKETIEYIAKSGYTLQTVPEKDEVVYMSDKGNISLGGDPIDVLDELSEETKQVAIGALKSIPGFDHGAVDVMIDVNEAGEESAYVIELNPTAQLGGILFPSEGKSRDIPSAIIDYYFPETKNIQTDKDKIYFDLKEALFPLQENVAVTTMIASFPQLKQLGLKVTIKNIYNLPNNLWIKNKALEYNIHGFIQEGLEEQCEIIVVGDEINTKVFLGELKKYFKLENQQVKVESWNNPVQVGFKVYNSKPYIIKELYYIDDYKKQLNLEKRSLEKDYYEMLDSFSWRITAPIRKITGKLKSYYRSSFKA